MTASYLLFFLFENVLSVACLNLYYTYILPVRFWLNIKKYFVQKDLKESYLFTINLFLKFLS